MRVTRHLLPAVAWGIGVAILVTLPLPLVVMEGAVPGHPTGDLADHLQGAWAVAEALRAGTRPDITGPTHFPGTLRLWFDADEQSFQVDPAELGGPLDDRPTPPQAIAGAVRVE